MLAQYVWRGAPVVRRPGTDPALMGATPLQLLQRDRDALRQERPLDLAALALVEAKIRVHLSKRR